MAKRIDAKKLPDFKKMTDAQISEFWDTHEVTEFLSELDEVPEKFKDARLKKLISIRIDEEAIRELKEIADLKGVGYQTLMRMWIKERLATERMKIA